MLGVLASAHARTLQVKCITPSSYRQVLFVSHTSFERAPNKILIHAAHGWPPLCVASYQPQYK